ncbi:unnamed protein product, partial [Gongylonema pulchrum]|uniref:Family with sequence similarity 122B n=1 Tax=Gongylonema pulchrum TaxID=637853 RepID=A0A183DZF3_9BILA
SGGSSAAAGDSGSGAVTGNQVSASGDAPCTHGCQDSGQSNNRTARHKNSLSVKSSEGLQVVPTPLHPIEEMPRMLLSRSLMPRSKTAEEVITKWVDFSFLDLAGTGKQQFQRCSGTPPRHLEVLPEECDYCNFGCIRLLRRSRSFPNLSCFVSLIRAPSFDWEDDSLLEGGSSLWTSTDSGCSSDGDTGDSLQQSGVVEKQKLLERAIDFEDCIRFVAAQS